VEQATAVYSNSKFTTTLDATLIFLFTFFVFWFSPVHQITDSHYSMLLSECLLKHRSFALDKYNIPRLEPNASTRDYYVMNGDIWQLELARGHIYYYFPPGSSVLSIPFVVVANAFGVSSANPDGTYNPANETRIQTSVAAILMALAAVVFYFTSNLLLPRFFSVVIALTAALGTQVWSTASRGLWSHTWAVLLSALIVWILLAGETCRRPINPYLLASLLAWLYFVRPNGSVVVVAVTIFMLLYHRQLFARFAVTGALWLAVFVTYSLIHFGKPLPSYYQASRLRFDLLPVALAGNTISPARGLFVYVPILLLVVYLLARYWKKLPNSRLAGLALAICVVELFAVSAFANLWGDWWGGASFGPRYTTELVPWFVLLAVLGLKARGDAHSWIESIAVVLLVLISVFINARGATSLNTWKWSQPSTDQQLRVQLWDWRHPQFLAGLQSPVPPVEYPPVEMPFDVDLTKPEAGKYLWYGWSGAEKDLRWTDGYQATIVFRLDKIHDINLDLQMAPFLSPQLVAQRVTIKLNNEVIQTVTMTDAELRSYSLALPASRLATNNVLTFELPDAVSPLSLKAGTDNRMLGIRVGHLQFHSHLPN
jgi:hypothetical protein